MLSSSFDICSITLSDGVYEVIKSPTGRKMDESTRLYLGKSKEGVYCALISEDRRRQLQVWLLTESCGKMEWGLKIDISLLQVMARFSRVSDDDENAGPWILHDGNCDEHAKEALVEDNSEWDFDNGIIVETEGNKVERVYRKNYFLGFHPHKEIVFLWVSEARAVAYDFNSSKVQDLGQLTRIEYLRECFPYTPCCTRELFENN
jgi:hypothetical protein